MIFSENILGIIFAITSALVWGSADFSGGFATRKNSQYQVLAISAFSGMVVLILLAVVWQESLPNTESIIWSILAGVSGAIGIAALYKALSISDAAMVAPIAAVIGAALPVILGIILVGVPKQNQLTGFVLAFVGIWMVSAGIKSSVATSRTGFLLAVVAGIAFGGFFILIAQVEAGKVFTPLVITRAAQFIVGLIFLRGSRQSFPSFTANPLAILAGVLDAGGNLFFLIARQYTRFDIAAVLSSLYPAATVILASLVLKQKLSKWQMIGLLFCLLATAFISI
jgi:drug/metabolite transporter (DMT)-like permease